MTWPEVTSRHHQAVTRVLNRGLLVDGPEVDDLEEEFADWLGASHCVAVTNGTVAITLALRVLGVGLGSRVAVPALSFSGTVLPVIHLGATPVWVDVDPKTYCMDADQLRDLVETGQVDTVIPVHLGGIPCDLPYEALRGVGIRVVEDACQAVGASVRGTPVGLLGDVGCFSLNSSKTFWAGEGGLLVTDSADTADELRSLRRFGESWPPAPRSRSYECVRVGYNARMPELSAAMARATLPDVSSWVRNSRSVVEQLRPTLEELGYGCPEVPDGLLPAWQKYRVTPPPGWRFDRQHFHRWQVMGLHQYAAFGAWHDRLAPNAESAATSTFILGREDHPICSWNPNTVRNVRHNLKEAARVRV